MMADQSLEPFQPGDQCSEYSIVRLLGRGGYGCVYEARRPVSMRLSGVIQDSEDRFALKCLRSDVADDGHARDRLNQEAFLLKQMNHKNIVRWIESGISDSGHDFFVMELLEGKSLASHLKLGRLSVHRSLEVARDIAEALSFAHETGVIHRDLKPGNVFVTHRMETKVLDLGAAKYKYGWDLFHSRGRPAFTVLYAAPEQLLGVPTDHRADIFALGVIAYEMLAGEHPFYGAAESKGESIGSQVQCRARPLLDFGIPDEVAAIVHRAIARRPEERHASMREFRNALHRLWASYELAAPQEEPTLSRASTVRVADPMAIFKQVTRPGLRAPARVVAESVDRRLIQSFTNRPVFAPEAVGLASDPTVFDRRAASARPARDRSATLLTAPRRPRRNFGWGAAAVAAALALVFPTQRMLANRSWRRPPEGRASVVSSIAASESESRRRPSGSSWAPPPSTASSDSSAFSSATERSGEPLASLRMVEVDRASANRASKREGGGREKRPAPRAAQADTENPTSWLVNPFERANSSPKVREDVKGELGVVPMPSRPSAVVEEPVERTKASLPKEDRLRKRQGSSAVEFPEPPWDRMKSSPAMPGDEVFQ